MKLVSGKDPRGAIRLSLPKDALRHLGWNIGDVITVAVTGNKIVLSRES